MLPSVPCFSTHFARNLQSICRKVSVKSSMSAYVSKMVLRVYHETGSWNTSLLKTVVALSQHHFYHLTCGRFNHGVAIRNSLTGQLWELEVYYVVGHEIGMSFDWIAFTAFSVTIRRHHNTIFPKICLRCVRRQTFLVDLEKENNKNGKNTCLVPLSSWTRCYQL